MDSTVILAMVMPWALIAFQGWLIYLLVRQHGRTLLAQDELRDRLAALEGALRQLSAEADTARRPGRGRGSGCQGRDCEGHGSRQAVVAQQPSAGLPVGSPAPEFSLPDLDGRERRLSDFRGRTVLLIFFNPQCGFCAQMAPRLGEIPAEGPAVLLVCQGDPTDLRRMAEEHGWRCSVLMERDHEVGTAYQSGGTPTGYLVDARGLIASNLAVGAEALLALLPGARGDNGIGGHGDGLTAASLRARELAAVQRARAAGLAVRESSLKRDGLAAGTPAPDFSLPDLAGASRSLSEFRGKRVLLVFSDPDCGPCQTLAPDLAQHYRQHRGENLEVVMVSRGGVEANTAGAERHGYEFPVLLQRHWEISREYAIFATPVAYLIDERGVIAADVAIGADAIRRLT